MAQALYHFREPFFSSVVDNGLDCSPETGIERSVEDCEREATTIPSGFGSASESRHDSSEVEKGLDFEHLLHLGKL